MRGRDEAGWRWIAWTLAVAALLWMVLVQALTMPRTTVSYSDFLGRVGRGDVRQVTLQGDAASGTLIPKSFKSRRKTVVLTILRIEEPAAREWR